MTKPWLLYCRVSTDAQAEEGVSLDAQETSCRAYAKARGWTVAEVITDAASGASLKRPGWLRVLDLLRGGTVAGVLCWRLDRLTRSLRSLLDLVDLSAAAGVSLVSVSEALDTSTPGGRLMLHMLGSFAQHERETISVRVTEAMSHVKRQGWWTGGKVPPGFRVVQDGQRRRMVLDDAQADLLRPAWSWALAGDGLQVIARRLAGAGLSPGKGWTASKVRNFLLSPQVVGFLVDAPTQAKVRAALASRRPTTRPAATASRAAVPSLLHGIAHCPLCGGALVQATVTNRHGTAYRYLRCALANKNRDLCPQKDVRADEAEAAAVGAVEDALRSGAYAAELLGLQREASQRLLTARQDRARASQERDQLAARVAHLCKTGRIGTPAFDLGMQALGNELTDLDRRLAELDGLLAAGGVDLHNAEVGLATVEAAMARMTIADCPREEQAAILRDWIDRVTVFDDRVELWMYQPDHQKGTNPPPDGGGFAHRHSIGTPTRTACKPVRVVIPRRPGGRRLAGRHQAGGRAAPLPSLPRPP